MAMQVKNNMDAIQTLNKLNQNSNALSKSLQKVSSGMKINGAKDGASEYSISERMRVQIRSLDQANQNTQNGNALLNTAEGAIQSSIDILRTLKEKAINAANDTNNDESDRQMIQKELNQFLDQLDDNAGVTYNGKILNEGTYAAIDSPETAILKGLNSQWIKNSLSMIRDAYGLSFEMGNTSVHNMNVTLTHNPSQANALAYVAVTTGSDGYASNLELVVNMNYYDNINLQDPNGSLLNQNYANMLDRTISHEMTHATMAANIKDFDSLPDYVIEGSAELIHGIDDVRTSNIQGLSNDPYPDGYVFLRYVEHQFSESGESAVKKLFQGLSRNGADTAGQAIAVSGATHGGFDSFATLKAKFESDKTAAGGNDAFLRNYCGIDLNNEDTGAILGWDANANAYRNKETTVPTGGTYSGWTYPNSSSSFYGLTVTWPDAAPADSSPMLKFHSGAKSQQMNSVSLGDMRAKALGLRMQDGNANVSLESRGKAEAAIAVFDAAIDYALEQQTRIGSIRARLDYTSSNLTTSSENTSVSESTIRDADMAKEMTEYTKNNVLLQSAQSMLAQANQNSSAVLSLLQ